MSAGRRRTSRRRRQPWWAKLDREQLLDVRLCDLGLEIRGTALEGRLDQLYAEFERRGLRLRPHAWLSTDWFTPDGVTGFAIPFFLANPRLCRIEHAKMFEVEGGTHDWCMRLLRHEAGHAIDNAYRLHRKKRWREVFGPFSVPYRQTYAANPLSRRYVQNLGFWYAQSHPAEDFAETFAVWLQPGSRWRSRYAGWPALRKLRFVDELMAEIGPTTPPVRSRQTPESLPRLKLTLREYYRRKGQVYGADELSHFDLLLDRVFSREAGPRQRVTAVSFLRRKRVELRTRVAYQTGVHRYLVDQAIHTIIRRCKQRRLRLVRPERESLIDVAILLTTVTTEFLRRSQTSFMR